MIQRFKTEYEFEAEFGPQWRDKVFWTILDGMDGAFGEVYNKPIHKNVSVAIPGTKITWPLNELMFTDKPLLPPGTKVAIPKTWSGKDINDSVAAYHAIKEGQKFLLYLPPNPLSADHHLTRLPEGTLNSIFTAKEILAAREEYLATQGSAEELLEEVLWRYPVGTKVRITHTPSWIWEITSHDIHKSRIYYVNGGYYINLIGKIDLENSAGSAKSSTANAGTIAQKMNGKIQWGKIVEAAKLTESTPALTADAGLDIVREALSRYKEGDIVISMHSRKEYTVVGNIRLSELSSNNVIADVKEMSNPLVLYLEQYNKWVEKVTSTPISTLSSLELIKEAERVFKAGDTIMTVGNLKQYVITGIFYVEGNDVLAEIADNSFYKNTVVLYNSKSKVWATKVFKPKKELNQSNQNHHEEIYFRLKKPSIHIVSCEIKTCSGVYQRKKVIKGRFRE